MARRESVDGKALRFAIGFPLILAFAFALAGFTFHGLVPHGVVMPVGGPALQFPIFLAVSALCIIVVGLIPGTQAARTRIPPPWRRFLMGLAVCCALVVTALFAAALIAQADTPEPPSARIDPIVFASGSGAAVALGVVMAFVFKPDEQWGRRDQEALARALDPDLERDTMQFWIHPRSSVTIMILLAGVFPGALLSLLLPWLGLVPILGALGTLAFLSAHVDANRGGVQVRVAGLLTSIRFRAEDLQGAAAAHVQARLYGGWGPRRRGTSGSFLAASGPAVVVRIENGSYVIGAPREETAELLAALLNRRASALGSTDL